MPNDTTYTITSVDTDLRTITISPGTVIEYYYGGVSNGTSGTSLINDLSYYTLTMPGNYDNSYGMYTIYANGMIQSVERKSNAKPLTKLEQEIQDIQTMGFKG